MYSHEPSSSGASVMSFAQGQFLNSSISGSLTSSLFCAPPYFGFIYGPSKWMPRIFAPSLGIRAVITRISLSCGAVIVVGYTVVVPLCAQALAISPNSASMVSIPTIPCVWISTSPGYTLLPSRSTPCSSILPI